ncbi:MAG: cytochrome c biogenesis protein CcsA [Thermoplasmata archaeon]|nr:cytochrome c biogenesis protein CcsA [Thermoplasmata archaeon]
MRLADSARITFILWSAVLVLYGILIAFLVVPPHEIMGDVQRIFYFHVASAWIAYVAFGVTFATSLVYMKTKDFKWDNWAVSSAEIGVVFTTLVILTGPMWAKAVWEVYWKWDDLKLLMTLVLWLVFIAYIALRANVQSRRTKASLAAVFSVIGMACVPLSFAANRIWTQYHPTVIASDKGEIVTEGMVPALIVAVFAMTFLYFALLLLRVGVANLQDRADELKEKVVD